MLYGAVKSAIQKYIRRSKMKHDPVIIAIICAYGFIVWHAGSWNERIQFKKNFHKILEQKSNAVKRYNDCAVDLNKYVIKEAELEADYGTSY